MTNLRRRIKQLEQRTAADNKEAVLVVVRNSAVELALDRDRCVEILEECGFVRSGSGVSILNFSRVPDGLNAKELERYFREHRSEERRVGKECRL